MDPKTSSSTMLVVGNKALKNGFRIPHPSHPKPTSAFDTSPQGNVRLEERTWELVCHIRGKR